MIVDTHVHVLGADRNKYPRQLHRVIPPDFSWTQDDYSAEQLLADGSVLAAVETTIGSLEVL